ncbi:MAG: quinone-interacting membrane-bound oxidoreductase complex subunit QmoC [Nitrospinae bacterium]|nr:quinone-interacting membrane-bound oxidoreductase complex subunit QmoC [Nitrospinota bacterium]
MQEVTTQVIRPDAGFVTELMENGGATLKKCFQCGNCSVVCNISPEEAPFPRKEMIWAQWGLKDRLLSDGDVWLCHQCNDCSTHCPRGAKPGDVLAAARNIMFSHYASFGFLGKWLSKPAYLPALFIIPLVWIYGFISLGAKPDFVNIKPMQYGNMMPELAIDMAFIPAVVFAVVAAFMSVKKFWGELNKAARAEGSLISAMIGAAIGVGRHEKMGKCVTNAPRFKSHLFTMYGFIALMITTAMVGTLYWAHELGMIGFEYHQIGLSHPARLTVKLVGNLGALMALAGVGMIIARRYGAAKDSVGVTGYYDSFFIFTLFITIASGILSEILRVLDVASLGFGVYYVHLVFVFVLLVYAPFSKFAHLLYRFTALTHARMTQRERAWAADHAVTN